ncbi:G5 domain-containing protein, partial [Streptococcus infantis]|uniref:G5 domain-containing protein n=1 Tax=Streptococcus infantis TaxID=68892 RepID=UPI0039C0024D
MNRHLFKEKQRFSLRKYAIGTCSVLLGTSLFFATSPIETVGAQEGQPQLVSHYVEDKDLPEAIKEELRWFEDNAIELEEGKDYYFVYRKSAASLPNTGLFSNPLVPVLGMGILLVSLTLIKKKKGRSLFLVTVLAVGGTAVSVSALEDLVELRPALVKTVEGEFLPRPEKIEGYEFTGYYFVRCNEEISQSLVTPSKTTQGSLLEQTLIPSHPGIIETPATPSRPSSEESTSIPPQGQPSLVEVKPELEISKESIPFDTIRQEDPNLPKGQTQVIQAGVAGERTILAEVTRDNGKESRQVKSNTVTQEPVSEIIAVGTKVESTSIPLEGSPSLVEVKPELETSTESVPFDRLYQEDPDLPKGQTRVIQAGVVGERTILTEVTRVDGKESRQVKSNTVTQEPVSEIIAVGSKVESTSIPL